MVDSRIASIQADAQQLRSIGDFTDSLVHELNVSSGTPGKELMRELLANGLRRALDLGGLSHKRKFLDALASNIHKFPLQEQTSLARVFPVEISSEYQNLQSFVADTGPEEEPAAGAGGAGAGAAALPTLGPVEQARSELASLPQKPGGTAAEELAKRITSEEALNTAVQALDSRHRQQFFSDLRLNLFKFTEASQRSLVNKFLELRSEVARLVESMTQEVSRWLDEDKQAVQQQPIQQGSVPTALLTKLRALLAAILSAPFLATFRHLSMSDKQRKEAFLLKVALCLRTCTDRSFTGIKEVADQSNALRRQFFYVEGYGELMDDWLQNRIQQFNDELQQKANSASPADLAVALTRLRRTLRPGRWMPLASPRLEDDVATLFLDEAFPRHVITTATIAAVLTKVAAHAGGDMHIYGDIARMPPAMGPGATSLGARDAVEVALMEVLKRFPPFMALRRDIRGRPGVFIFGRIEVEFSLRGDGSLVAKQLPGNVESTAEEFFLRAGPEEHPTAAFMAVKTSEATSDGPVPTVIQDLNSLLPGAGMATALMPGVVASAPLTPATPSGLTPSGLTLTLASPFSVPAPPAPGLATLPSFLASPPAPQFTAPAPMQLMETMPFPGAMPPMPPAAHGATGSCQLPPPPSGCLGGAARYDPYSAPVAFPTMAPPSMAPPALSVAAPSLGPTVPINCGTGMPLPPAPPAAVASVKFGLDDEEL